MTRPWYSDLDEWIERADGLLAAVRALPADAPHHAELRSYAEFSTVRVIFESNQIEGVGPSEGETRRVLDRLIRPLEDPGGSARLSTSLPSAVASAVKVGDAVAALGVPRSELTPFVSFKGRSKDTREVEQHYTAYRHALAIAADFRERFRDHAMAQWAFQDSKFTEQLVTRFEEQGEDRARFPLAFKAVSGALRTKEEIGDAPTIEWVAETKRLHRILAEDLLPDDATVEAGDFRIDSRSVGTDVPFPAPELIPDAMAAWSKAASRLVWMGPLAVTLPNSAIGAAARVSYDFVRIHPFPDGNGRVSRLLMNMILALWGLPFPVALRGDRVGRQRYKQALRRADRGRMDRYECLIARAVVAGFEDVNVNLALAGIPPLEPAQR